MATNLHQAVKQAMNQAALATIQGSPGAVELAHAALAALAAEKALERAAAASTSRGAADATR